jgi:ferredoxin-thioredoxin reductase catalytic subunit
MIDGWKLNPDEDHVKLIRKGIEKRDGYCPCKIHRGDHNICPCLDFREGRGCHCGLYVEEK